MQQSRTRTLVTLSEKLPVCAAHPTVISYVTCRRCNAPVCSDCRTSSRLGQICRACVTELRDKDSTVVGAPLPLASIILCLVALVLGIAQSLSPALVRDVAYAPFVTLVQPWRFLTGLIAFPGADPLLASLAAVVCLALAGCALETLRGAFALISTALTCGIAGLTAAFLLTGPADAHWFTALGGAPAMTAGLVVSGAGAALALRRRTPALITSAALLVLVATGLFLAPVSLTAVIGGATAGIIAEVIRSFFRRPQRAVLPLMVSLGSCWALIAVAIVIRGLFG